MKFNIDKNQRCCCEGCSHHSFRSASQNRVHKFNQLPKIRNESVLRSKLALKIDSIMQNMILIVNFIGYTSLQRRQFKPLNAELNPICHLLALAGAHHFVHVSRLRVKELRNSTVAIATVGFFVVLYVC